MLQKIRFEWTCKVCGKTLYLIKSRLKTRVTCSHRCNAKLIKDNIINRFWDKVFLPFDATNTECWSWIGGKDKDGYGVFSVNSYDKAIKAHRYSYSRYKGLLLDNFLVCHTCDNPSCINPSHLFLGTSRDNVKDCIEKNRRRKFFKTSLTQSDLSKMQELENTKSQYEIAKEFNISHSYVSLIFRKKTKVHIHAEN